MELSGIDLAVFLGFLAVVVGVSLYAGRKEKTSEDYFLAGRKLTWYLIGFSLIASNISTEHFVGMAGSAFGRVGLAIASYEWMAAVTLVIVAWWLLPKFLRAGIYTMPEFLEYRYDSGTRAIMAIYLMLAYIIVLLAVVLYSGALAFNAIFEMNKFFEVKFNLDPAAADRWANIVCIWCIGIIAATYTIYGGLKSVVWSDLLQGGALILGGAIGAFFGLRLIGDGSLMDGWRSFVSENADKLHMVKPWDDKDMPWVAVFIGGLWIPNLFYWGLNQFITQRILGAKSLAQGQKGIMLAALIKLVIPFIIVMPGIMAFQLYGDEINALGGNTADKAYPYMISHVLPPSLRGAMFAALLGAVMSTFNSGINSASTIFTIDIYGKYIEKEATAKRQVLIGRIATAVIVVVACLWAPVVGRSAGVFKYIQEIWGFITPGIVAAFLVGLGVKKAPAAAAKAALLLGPVLYAICRVPGWLWDYSYRKQNPDFTGGEIPPPEGIIGVWVQFSKWAFLHHMMIIFLILAVVMVLIRYQKPLSEPVTMPVNEGFDTAIHKMVYVWGGLIIALTILLYIIFW